MTPLQVVFIVTALIVLGAAFMVVTTRILVRAALWLVLTLFGVAILFALLEAGFLAVVQVVIYIGAIAILFIFAVMLTRKVMEDSGSQTNNNWWIAALGSVLLFAGLVWLITNWGGAAIQAPSLSDDSDFISKLGTSLVSPNQYVLPFEVASILLVAALIGAIVVAWDRK